MNLWWNDYIGIPYAEKGRNKSGLDCWGLVRLVYKEQYNIEIPSFAEDYESYNEKHIQELILIGKENWTKVSEPSIGDAILLRINGLFMHVGVVVSDNQFIHVREGQDTVIERFDTGVWKHRVEGFYKYTEQHQHGDLTLAVCPHPLKTQRIDEKIAAGSTLAEIIDFIKTEYPVAKEYNIEPTIIVNGKVIPKEEWTMVPLSGDVVQYRAVATGGGGGGFFRAILSIAVVVAAAYFAPAVAGAIGVSSSLGVSIVQAGLSVVGSLLINAIFPVRLPKPPKDPGTAKAQNLLQGGSNQANFYGAIPVVLGRARYTAPLGASIYAETNTDTAYLRMALVWGYGPLQVSDMRVGDTSIYSLEELDIETLNGFDDTPEDTANFNRIYGQDTEQVALNLKLTQSLWVERVINEEADYITVTFHFPEGLRSVSSVGNIFAFAFRADVQVRQLDSDTLVPITSFGNIETLFPGATVTLTPAWFNIDNDAELEPVYRWTRIAIDERSRIKTYTGAFSTSASSNPTGNLLLRQQEANFGFSSTYNLIPDIPEGEELIWDVVVYGNTIHQIIDRRASAGADFTGCDLTMNGFQAIISSGTIQRSYAETVRIGAEGEAFAKRKDAFSYSVKFYVARGKYEVRVRKTSSDSKAFPDGKGYRYNDTYLSSITVQRAARPITPPKKLAMTAMRVKATNQINGQLDGIAATVTSICFDYTNRTVSATRASNVVTVTMSGALTVAVGDRVNIHNMSVSTFNGSFTVTEVVDSTTFRYNQTGANASATGGRLWQLRPTRNPASLFRYVLQHPGNAQAVADSKIDLNELYIWHNYCRTNSFMYDAVINDQESLLDVLRDICAAGRSSPTLRDGIWTIITDKPRTVIAQYFTPHNSWGFEGVRALPKLPHAFRVQFQNSEKGFQPDEMIVYNDGFSSANATLFEELTLPGVTTKNAIFKHARFHFAQLKLRPETYILNADMEHLVCTRGDRVKVTHDVPMWGLGTGRIVERLNTTDIVLDEKVPMDAGVQYTIRIRKADGSSITRTVQPKLVDGYYDEITCTSAVSDTDAATGNLFMFGSLNAESVDLIVQSIEPSENLSARLTLVDYSPAIYNSDTEEIPPFNSQITKPPVLLQQKITVRPTISNITSDESALLVNNLGKYTIRMKIAYENPRTLPDIATNIEAQIAFIEDNSLDWEFSQVVPVKQGSIYFSDVQELEEYKVRIRYVTDDGRVGPWTTSVTHKIIGKTLTPFNVNGFTATLSENQVKLSWSANPELDIVGYEIREADTGWSNANALWRGNALNTLVQPAPTGTTKTWFIKAFDANNLYSDNAANVSFLSSIIPTPDTVTFVFADTALTNATITIDWSDVNPQFGLDYYTISYGSVSKNVKASTITLPADWIGDRQYSIVVRDLRGNTSVPFILDVEKLVPNPVTGLAAQVIDNNVLLSWNLPTKTTLPIQYVEVRKGNTYSTATIIGTKDGGFTTLQENTRGTYKYWVTVVDTDNNYSSPVAISAFVNEPPDFVFNAKYTSTFGGTKSSAMSEQGGILLPVDLTDTWTTHFTDNSWSDPQDQIDAGYPVFIQPVPASGYYEEVFDYGTVLSSSRVTVAYSGLEIDEALTIKVDISVSNDGITYATSENTTSIFTTNFRYVKVRFTVNSDAVGVYLLQSLTVTLDSKLKNDGGNKAVVSTDTNGTIQNFNAEFIDVESITVSPQGTTLLTPVYNFQDAVLTGTYSVTSNVATINVTGHDLIAGQKVRLNFTSGTAPNGVYTVASVVNANQYTVNITTANTSGNISTYPEGFRIYLFNSAGSRVSGTVSWQARGY